MGLHLLDTDTLSLVERSHPVVVRRLKAVHPKERGITVISLEEQMRGRLAQAAKAKSDGTQSQRAYHLLRNGQILFCLLLFATYTPPGVHPPKSPSVAEKIFK